MFPSSCDKHMLLFQIIDRLKKLVSNERLEVLDNYMFKVKLFVTHYVRSFDKKSRCDELKKGLTDD